MSDHEEIQVADHMGSGGGGEHGRGDKRRAAVRRASRGRPAGGAAVLSSMLVVVLSLCGVTLTWEQVLAIVNGLVLVASWFFPLPPELE